MPCTIRPVSPVTLVLLLSIAALSIVPQSSIHLPRPKKPNAIAAAWTATRTGMA